MDALKNIDYNLIASRILSEKIVIGSVLAVEKREGSFRSVAAAESMAFLKAMLSVIKGATGAGARP